jgi:hypothetical protein
LTQVFATGRSFFWFRHARPFEGHPDGTAVEAGAVASVPLASDVKVYEPGINAGVADPQEVDRRRNLVRTFFNDFWSGVSDKPAAFAQRLDEAEDYLNERLAANGEFWRLDANTRAMLGLPHRSKSSV